MRSTLIGVFSPAVMPNFSRKRLSPVPQSPPTEISAGAGMRRERVVKAVTSDMQNASGRLVVRYVLGRLSPDEEAAIAILDYALHYAESEQGRVPLARGREGAFHHPHAAAGILCWVN